MTTPDYAREMLAANSPGARRIASGPVGVGLRGGVRTLYLAVPVGYKLLSYFGLSRTTVVRMRGRWQIAETRAGFARRLSWPPGRDRSAQNA